MTASQLAKHLFSTYDRYRLGHLSPGNCKHDRIFADLFDLVVRSDKMMAMTEVGCSVEGRSINMVTLGKGPKKVLLWSQMHGDESTATLALMDVFNLLLQRAAEEKWIGELLAGTTLRFIPMLNPDGAERRQRRTVVGIDMNRDALDVSTPEARILRDVQHRFKPAFGFNLHDQELSSVGGTRKVTAVALLAPAADEKKTKPPVRVRAMRVAALIARTLEPFAPGHLASYDDAFEPRAFGDTMQRRGTSTVLIESGHWPDDREKSFIRKLNYIGILAALHGIADGSFQDVDLDYYAHLAPNTKRIYDVIIRDVKLQHGTGWSHAADVGIFFEPERNKGSETIATIKDLGDLSTFGALKTIDGGARTARTEKLRPEQSLPMSELLDLLQLPQW